MVKQNNQEEVEAVTKKALAALPNLSEAMTHLTKLKAVGPATASGTAQMSDLFCPRTTLPPEFQNIIYSKY